MRQAEAQGLKAAQYVWISTEHQKYSTENQSVTNHAYAAQRGWRSSALMRIKEERA
jgi:hypothetical protein